MLRPPRSDLSRIKQVRSMLALRQEGCGRRDAEPFFVLVVNIKRPD